MTQSLYSQKADSTNIEPRFIIGDSITPKLHIYQPETVEFVSKSQVYTGYLKKDPTGTIVEEGEFKFNHHNDTFRITYKGSLYLNFHARPYARDENRAIYMVNPNTFVTITATTLQYVSDQDETLILFFIR